MSLVSNNAPGSQCHFCSMFNPNKKEGLGEDCRQKKDDQKKTNSIKQSNAERTEISKAQQ